MYREIIFITSNFDDMWCDAVYHNDTIKQINNQDETIVVTSQLHLICFDLLDTFAKIYLKHNGVLYDLKLGSNTWIVKNLRKEHNLLKLVKCNILNNE